MKIRSYFEETSSEKNEENKKHQKDNNRIPGVYKRSGYVALDIFLDSSEGEFC